MAGLLPTLAPESEAAGTGFDKYHARAAAVRGIWDREPVLRLQIKL